MTQHGKRQKDKFSLHTSPFEVWRNSLHLKKKGKKETKRIFSEKEVSLEGKLEGNKIETPLFIRVCKGSSMVFSSKLFFTSPFMSLMQLQVRM